MEIYVHVNLYDPAVEYLPFGRLQEYVHKRGVAVMLISHDRVTVFSPSPKYGQYKPFLKDIKDL